MAERYPPELQQQAARLQQLQQQLAQILTEKTVVQTELREVNRALDVLKDLPDDAIVYKSAGHLLIKISKSNAEKELNDKKELLELRLKSLEKQESIIRSQINEVQSRINEIMARSYGRRSETRAS